MLCAVDIVFSINMTIWSHQIPFNRQSIIFKIKSNLVLKRFTACRIVWRQNIHFYQKDQALDTKDDQISVNVRVKWPRELFGKEGCVCTREILKKCSKLDNWNRSNCLCVVGKYKRSVIKHHSTTGLGLHTFFVVFIVVFLCAGVILLTKIMFVSTCRGLLRKRWQKQQVSIVMSLLTSHSHHQDLEDVYDLFQDHIAANTMQWRQILVPRKNLAPIHLSLHMVSAFFLLSFISQHQHTLLCKLMCTVYENIGVMVACVPTRHGLHYFQTDHFFTVTL